MTIGIYKLEFLDSTFYIGRSVNIENRYKDHCSMLTRGVNTCPLIQKKYNEIGVVPTLVVIEKTSLETISEKEVYWISTLEATTKGLNILPGGEDILVGDKHPMSKYTNTQIYSVLEMLSSRTPIYSHKEIEEITKVKATTVKDIVCGLSHTWLQQQYPNMYAEMFLVKLDRQKINSLSNLNPQANKKVLEYPPVISPSGEIHTIDHLTKFSQAHNLQASNLSKVLSGKRQQHKGWKLF